jgi:3-mercaptopyruvate sulfurtransferase SseA
VCQTPPFPIRRFRVLSFLRKLTAGVPSITVEELDELLAMGAARLIDIREESEFRGGTSAWTRSGRHITR